MADNTARIAEIQEILRGPQTISVDGVSQSFDFRSLRRELRELMATDDTYRGRRPVVSSIKLGDNC